MRPATIHRAAALLAASLALAPATMAAQIALPERARETASITEPRDRVSLPVGVMTLDGDGTERLEGRVVRQSFVLEVRDGATPLSLLEQAVDPLRRNGWTLVFDCVDSGCGGAVARFSLPLLPAPEMRLDTADMALATFNREEGSETRWITVIASRVLGQIYVQIVRVGPPTGQETIETTVTSSDPGETSSSALTTGAGAVAGALSQDSEALYGLLTETGRAALFGIEFEPGGARIAAGGDAVMTAVAAMLETHGDLRAAVVGHTDYLGDFDSNMALARARAEAVVNALVAAGIARGRLEVHAVGPLAPVASNATPEGRALNRRVELVLIP